MSSTSVVAEDRSAHVVTPVHPHGAPAVRLHPTGFLIQQGTTPHFEVWYDTGLLQHGPTLANALLNTCESDYDRIQAFFPGLANNPFRVQTGTPILESDAANFVFAARTGSSDLVCLKRTHTATPFLEAHVLAGASDFQAFDLQTPTAIGQADAANFDFAVGPGGDLYCLKRLNAASGMLELHVLRADTAYQAFRVQTATAIHLADARNFSFAIQEPTGDLFCFKRTNTASQFLEVHILTAASDYQSFRLQTATPITELDAANFDFAVGGTSVFCVKRRLTDTGKVEVHVLDGGNDYHGFTLQTATPITLADAPNFSFAVGDTFSDLYCIKQAHTGTNRLEVHVLAASAAYLGGLHFRLNLVPDANGGGVHYGCSATTLVLSSIDGTDADQVRVAMVGEADEVFMAAQGNGWDCGRSAGEGLSRAIAGELYPTPFQQFGYVTAPAWLKGSRPNWIDQNSDDLDMEAAGCAALFLMYLHYQLGFPWQAIAGTGGSTLARLHAALTGIEADAFLPFATLLEQAFPQGKTVSLTSDNPFPLSPLALQTTVPIPQLQAADFVFGAGSFGGNRIPDLYAIRRAHTASGHVEVEILDGATNYQSALLRVATPITLPDAGNFDFVLGDFDRDGIPDLFCIKRSHAATRRVEVHVLSGASQYQAWLVQTATPIALTDAPHFVFAASAAAPDLYCLKRSATGSGRLELHGLSGASSFQQFWLQTPTPISEADAVNFAFAVADYDRDGIPDLYCLKHAHAASGKLEVHILAGVNGFQGFRWQKATPIPQASAALFQFALADWNGDGLPDVFCLERGSHAAGMLRLQVLNGGAGY